MNASPAADTPDPRAALRARIDATEDPADRAALLVELAQSLPPGERPEVIDLAREAVTLAGDDRVAGLAWYLIAEASFHLSRFAEAEAAARESLTLAGRANDLFREHKSANLLGLLARQRGDRDQAVALFERSLTAADRLNDDDARMRVYTNLGSLMRDRGEPERAVELQLRALDICERRPDARMLTMLHLNLGASYADLGDWRKSVESFYRALGESEKLQDWRGMALSYLNLAETFRSWGDAPRALKAAEQAVESARNAQSPLELARAWGSVGEACALAGDTPRAISVLDENIRAARELNLPLEVMRSLARKAELLIDLREPDAALPLLQEAQALVEPGGPVPLRARVQTLLGKTWILTGETDRSRLAFETALAGYRSAGENFGLAQTCLDYGRFLVEHNQVAAGRPLIQEAIRIFRQLDAITWARRAEASLPADAPKVAARPPESPAVDDALIGASPATRELDAALERAARADAPVLIGGEPGSGKGLAARLILRRSSRARDPFLQVNCAGVPEPLLEPELFGRAGRPGKLEQAHRGTLLIRGIEHLGPGLQARILRGLQAWQLETAEEDAPVAVDVRLIATFDPRRFDPEPYARLSAITLIIPPLRARPADIPELVAHFTLIANEAFQRHVQGVEPEVLDVFSGYPWPGNVRELSGAVERAVIVSRSDLIQLADLPAAVRSTRGA